AATTSSGPNPLSRWIPGTVWGVMPRGATLVVHCPDYLGERRKSGNSGVVTCGPFFVPSESDANLANAPFAPSPDGWQVFRTGVMNPGEVWKLDCPNPLGLQRIDRRALTIICSATNQSTTTTAVVQGTTTIDPTTTVPPTSTSTTTTAAPTTTTLA